MRKTPVATGMTARERIAVSICVKVLVTIFGLVFRRLSPKSAPAHWKSWEGADSCWKVLTLFNIDRNTIHESSVHDHVTRLALRAG